MKPDSSLFDVARSVFKATAARARNTLNSDSFLILIAYPKRRDFDLYLDTKHGDNDKETLYKELQAVDSDLWITSQAITRTSDFDRTTSNQFASSLLEVLGAKAAIISPLAMEYSGLGYACWAWKDEPTLSDNELVKANLVGEQIALSLKVCMSEKRSKEYGDKLAALLELSTAMYSSLNYKEVVRKAVQLSMEIVGADGGTIFTLDKDDMTLQPLLTVDERHADAINAIRLQLGEGISGKVAQTGVGIISNHSEKDPRSFHVPGTPNEPESLISVPLTWSGEVIGVITLRNTKGKTFSREDLEILTIFARHSADAIENARLFENLEKAYEDLTATQEQLIMAEKLKALRDLSGGVAHDFNNVLGTILGRAQLLLKKTEDPEWKHDLQVIETVALEGKRTVQRLQDFTCVSRKTHIGRVCLNDVVEQAVDYVKPAWKDTVQKAGRTINLETDLQPIPMIEGNQEELKEAVSNVLLNCVDALPDGGNIWVKTAFQDGKVILSVADDGIGMDEKTKNKLFFPFFSTKGRKGTGMGLAIVYGILFRHKADIEVESTPGNGAVFTFKFEPAGAPAVETPQETQKVQVGRLSILLVDDDQNLLDVVGDIIEFLGHDFEKADGGKAALDALAKQSFDLVITDLGMPDVSGWEVAKYCRQKYPDTPIILISGWGAQLDTSEALKKVDAVVPKPFRLEEIREAIEKVTTAARQEQTA